MGNAQAHDPDRLHLEPEIIPDPERGVLSWLTADVWAAGTRELPQPCLALAGQQREVIVRGVPRFGVVRMVFEVSSYRHGRSTFWTWQAVHAAALLQRVPVREVRWYGPELEIAGLQP